MRDVERVDREELNLSRREVMGASSAVAGAAVVGVMPREVAAQSDPDNEISGTVTDADGNAVDGVTVIAVPHDSSLDVLRTTTDANGDYMFDDQDLHGGEKLYHVICRDGTEASPRRGQENYPFISAEGTAIDTEGLHAHYDATDLSLSDGADVTTWGDASGGGRDLSATNAPDYLASGINGKGTVRFDPSNSELLSTDFSAVPQPLHIFVVAKLRDPANSENHFLFSGNDSGGRADLWKDTTDAWTIYAGSSTQSGSATDSNVHTFSALYDGADTTVRVDGTEDIAADAGTSDLIGFGVGGRAFDNSNFGAWDVAEILVYEQDKTATQTEIEQYLNDKWKAEQWSSLRTYESTNPVIHPDDNPDAGSEQYSPSLVQNPSGGYYMFTKSDESPTLLRLWESSDGISWTRTSTTFGPSDSTMPIDDIYTSGMLYDPDAGTYHLWYRGRYRDSGVTDVVGKATGSDPTNMSDIGTNPVLESGDFSFASGADYLTVHDVVTAPDGTIHCFGNYNDGTLKMYRGTMPDLDGQVTPQEEVLSGETPAGAMHVFENPDNAGEYVMTYASPLDDPNTEGDTQTYSAVSTDLSSWSARPEHGFVVDTASGTWRATWAYGGKWLKENGTENVTLATVGGSYRIYFNGRSSNHGGALGLAEFGDIPDLQS